MNANILFHIIINLTSSLLFPLVINMWLFDKLIKTWHNIACLAGRL
jgi:hypothetical protein